MPIMTDEIAVEFEWAGSLIKTIDRECFDLREEELRFIEHVEFLIAQKIPLAEGELKKLSSIYYNRR